MPYLPPALMPLDPHDQKIADQARRVHEMLNVPTERTSVWPRLKSTDSALSRAAHSTKG